MKRILIIGAGSHGPVVAETAAACGYEEFDYLDDRHPEAIGNTDQLEMMADEYDGVIVSIGNNEIRRTLIRRLQSADAPLISLIHPRAYVSPSAEVGIGSIVLPGAIIHTNVKVGQGCIISIGALIDHGAVIEDFAHIDAGAVVSAGKKASGKVGAGEII